jgi:glycosyltransferase involved in cell wall biosynthesis/ubiquinone/menaquinone biosynthesis C-methylase UbiE
MAAQSAIQLNTIASDSRTDCQGKRIGILIVAYNAATTLKKVLARIPADVWSNVEEVTLFDDASPDETYEVAVGLKATQDLDKLQILKHKKNLGYGGNQKAGYQYMISRGFDVVVLLHGDGQYAPEVLSHLYSPIVRGEADAVFGSRMMSDYGGPLKGGMPLYKYVGNRILTFFENRSLGMHLTEFHSGYRAYSLDALKRIDMSQMTDDFHFDTEIIIKLQHQRFRIAEVPIPTYYGDEICYVNGMKYARDVYHAVRRYKATVQSNRKAPEFAEYFAHYPIKESRGSSHQIALELAGTGNEVLDVGCGEGYFAEKLAVRGNKITGVDFLEYPSQREAFAAYLQANLQEDFAPVAQRLGDQKFDRVLLLDVLEHLLAPETLLSQLRPLLRRDGQVIVSLPNVANLSVRLLLLFGNFDYQERGILDRTHLHFYTRKTARALLEQQGFEILEERLTLIPVELALGLSPRNLLVRVLNRMLALCTTVLPGVFGYQIMFRARAR